MTTQIGALISAEHLEKVLDLLKRVKRRERDWFAGGRVRPAMA